MMGQLLIPKADTDTLNSTAANGLLARRMLRTTRNTHPVEMREHGVTLIELLVVISIITIILTMATLSMNFVKRQAVSSTTREIVSDIQQLRINALTRGDPGLPNMRGYGMRLASPNSFVTFAFNDVNPTDYTYSGPSEEAKAVTRTVSSWVTMQIPANYGPQYNILIYDRLGVPVRYMPDGTQYAPPANQPVLVLTVSDQAGNADLCIAVGLNSVREGAWNNAASNCFEQ